MPRRIAARALGPAVSDGRNLAARSDMLMASMMGAIAFQKDLGAVHSCAHALGAVLNVHHGLAIGSQQCLDFTAQGVVATTSCADKCSTLCGRTFERRLEQTVRSTCLVCGWRRR